ncbi:MAG: SHOCT domain-containing protein [Sphingobium sp.]
MTDKDRDGQIAVIAQRHGVSAEAARVALTALEAGHGRQAQFNHPDLGGMGQWSSGGMMMIGDMFNNGLKAKVAALIDDLGPLVQEPAATSGSAGGRWPSELGIPSSSGSQNDMHYAVFPATRRLAVETDGAIAIYDTGDYQIGGVGQQQGGGQSLRFSSQKGSFDVSSLKRVDDGGKAEEKPAPTAKDSAPSEQEPEKKVPDDVVAKIEQLHGLMEKGILSREEFDAKKAELLARI